MLHAENITINEGDVAVSTTNILTRRRRSPQDQNQPQMEENHNDSNETLSPISYVNNTLISSTTKLPMKSSSTVQSTTRIPASLSSISSTTTTSTTSPTTATATTMKTTNASADATAKSEVLQTAALPLKLVEQDKKFSKLIIHMKTFLQPGVNYTVEVKFSGRILNNLIGLYKASYKTGNGVK